MVKRLIGSDTTGTDGSVSIPYTGTGAGVVNLSVETEIDGSIVSETYSVLDCIVYDDMETETYKNYYKLFVSPSPNLEYSTEYAKTGSKSLKWSYVSGGGGFFGFQFRSSVVSNSFPITPLVGQDIRFEIDTYTTIDNTNASGFYIGIYYQTESNPSWSTLATRAIRSGEQNYKVDVTFPSDVTQVWIRCNIQNTSGTFTSGDLYVDNWEIYPI